MNALYPITLVRETLRQPEMRLRLAGLVVTVYCLLLAVSAGRTLNGLPADLMFALLGLPPLGWAACILLAELYARTERFGLALPATMAGMFSGFALLLWVLTRVLLRLPQ